MVSVLFAAKTSIYKTIPGLDVWDEERNALNWPGGNRGIFHPPCRLWSMLSHLSTAPEAEKYLGFWAIEQVRLNGGILEHPAFSKLFKQCLPCPGNSDAWGYTIEVRQGDFGHQGLKRTWLYVAGIDGKSLPDLPPASSGPFVNVFAGGNRKYTKGSRHGPLRSGTPAAFAHWLIEAVST